MAERPVTPTAASATLATAEYVALTTYRRDGTPVTTPVWIALDGDRLVIWTAARSGKARRLRLTPHLRLAPSDYHGSALGETVSGSGTILDRGALPRARQVMLAKYGWKFRYFAALIRIVQLTRLDSLIRASRVRGAAGGPAVVQVTLDRARRSGYAGAAGLPRRAPTGSWPPDGPAAIT
ncbi:MAG: PPOX class F420-dependent oxidoreductase [Actinobacteria bacterium]|nr:PPOX class F420-dependent oxidoreductase [Actinomycetota bacterium]